MDFDADSFSTSAGAFEIEVALLRVMREWVGVDDEADVIFRFAFCERTWPHAGLGLREDGVFPLDGGVKDAGSGPLERRTFDRRGRFVWTKLSPEITETGTSRSKFASCRSRTWIWGGTITARWDRRRAVSSKV
jgi:hypothetical protein